MQFVQWALALLLREAAVIADVWQQMPEKAARCQDRTPPQLQARACRYTGQLKH